MPQRQKSSRISFPTTHLILAEFDVLAVNREAVAIVARHGGQIPPKERCKQNLSPMSRVQVPCRSVVASLEVPAPSRSPQKGGEYNTQFHSQDSPSEQEVSTRDSSSPYGGSHIVVLTVYVNSAKRPPRLNIFLMLSVIQVIILPRRQVLFLALAEIKALAAAKRANAKAIQVADTSRADGKAPVND